MITSSLVLAVLQFFALNEPMFTPPLVNPAPKAMPLTPDEPTTLALALIGIGLVAVYAVVKWILRPYRESRRIFMPPAHADAARSETRTRGAA